MTDTVNPASQQAVPEEPKNGQPINLIKDTASIVRQQALSSASLGSATMGSATPLIDYYSSGHCLIIGETEKALALVPQLAPLKTTVLSVSASHTRPVKQLTDTGVTVFESGMPLVSGHLGAFQVQVTDQGRVHDLGVMSMTDTGMFDLILDLSATSLIDARLPPFGFYPASTQAELDKALAELPQLIGEFDKPRYFDYNADICAHSRSNLIGCSQCLDVCSTNAISQRGEGVEINPFLCQGCGSCATVCPSGAMTYAWPRPADAISKTRDLLDQHHSNATVLMLYSQADDENADLLFEQSLPIYVVPVAVEEVSAFGIDYWATMLVAGFQQIIVLVSDDADDPNTLALQQQAAVLEAVMRGIGHSDSELPTSSVLLLPRDSEELQNALVQAESLQLSDHRYARFATHNDKRQTFRMAIDELVGARKSSVDVVPLPDASPFGRVNVDADGCTLCLACVSVCPAGALLDGQEVPKLRFIEANCVQCGLCEKACPEQVISLTAQYTVNSLEAREPATLNEEQPFHCVRCHKAFATQKMIDTMTSKLSGHWMFGDVKAMRRLKMCEDCRVKDMFEDEDGGIEVHRET